MRRKAVELHSTNNRMLQIMQRKIILISIMLVSVCSLAHSEENIHTYIMSGDINKVTVLLDEHPDYIHQKDAGFTPLVRSVAQG